LTEGKRTENGSHKEMEPKPETPSQSREKKEDSSKTGNDRWRPMQTARDRSKTFNIRRESSTEKNN